MEKKCLGCKRQFSTETKLKLCAECNKLKTNEYRSAVKDGIIKPAHFDAVVAYYQTNPIASQADAAESLKIEQVQVSLCTLFYKATTGEPLAKGARAYKAAERLQRGVGWCSSCKNEKPVVGQFENALI